eukprot:scaffold2144_cov334-Prasinococcus_capsulatus_cf.AAC.16
MSHEGQRSNASSRRIPATVDGWRGSHHRSKAICYRYVHLPPAQRARHASTSRGRARRARERRQGATERGVRSTRAAAAPVPIEERLVAQRPGHEVAAAASRRVSRGDHFSLI